SSGSVTLNQDNDGDNIDDAQVTLTLTKPAGPSVPLNGFRVTPYYQDFSGFDATGGTTDASGQFTSLIEASAFSGTGIVTYYGACASTTVQASH
ncbi:MAG: hypothetical protein ABEK42_03570, partial [Thiohalorhabdaceae bacterium]